VCARKRSEKQFEFAQKKSEKTPTHKKWREINPSRSKCNNPQKRIDRAKKQQKKKKINPFKKGKFIAKQSCQKVKSSIFLPNHVSNHQQTSPRRNTK
jgi:hypothetical protein